MHKHFIALFLIFSSIPSWAAVSCTVSINNVLLYKSGEVNVRHTGRGEYTYICSLNEEWDGVPITTCAMWASMLLNIHQNDEQAKFYYADSAAYSSCANLPIYGNSPAPIYIGSVD